MKVWVCRDDNGWYWIFKEKCRPKIESGCCTCPCLVARYQHEIGSNEHCAETFKLYTGLPKHLRKGSKRLMEWTPPLAGK